MEAELTQAYADQNVRVVVALIQDADYVAPDEAFCRDWVDTYGLTNPVVMDPTQETGIYFPAGSLPAALIVDSEGTIRYREYGYTEALAGLTNTLDMLLAE